MILREIFQGRESGFYVDVGAYDSIRFSNTNYFYQRGWRGINIEPSPDAIDRFMIERQGDVNLNLGISYVSGILEYYTFDEAALNTVDKERVNSLENATPYRHNCSISVPVRTLREVLC